MGDAEALHQMRIALTRLRTALSFFSPMVADFRRERVRRELKWSNAHLGAVRDLDVAIERLMAINKQQPQAASNDPSGTHSAPPAIDSWRGRFAQPDIGGSSKAHTAGLKTDPGPSRRERKLASCALPPLRYTARINWRAGRKSF